MNASRVTTLLAGDALCFFLALAVMVGFETNSVPTAETLLFYTKAFLMPFLIFLGINYITNLYDIESTVATPRSIGRFILATLLSGSITALFFYLFPKIGITPKTNLVILSAAFFMVVVLWRRTYFYLFANSISRRVFFIGESPETERLQEEFKKHSHIGRTVGSARTLDEYLAKPTSADLLVLAREIGIQDIERAARIPIPIITVHSAFEELFGRIPLAHFSAEDAFALLEKKLHASQTVLYRFFEILIAILVLIVFSPLLLIAALGIFFEDGTPLLYKQERVGFKGKHFLMYKLRTMKKNAEETGAQWATRSDSRQTKIGRILRKLHLDEALQMVNIIRGDIALVGPRPERPEFVATLEQQIPFYFIRDSIKPGFTGWAQIKYRYARTVEDSREKFEYDLYYIRHRNILLDLGILAKTVQIIFTH